MMMIPTSFMPGIIMADLPDYQYGKGKHRRRNKLEQQIFALKKIIKRRDANKRARKARRINRK